MGTPGVVGSTGDSPPPIGTPPWREGGSSQFPVSSVGGAGRAVPAADAEVNKLHWSACSISDSPKDRDKMDYAFIVPIWGQRAEILTATLYSIFTLLLWLRSS